MITSLSDQLRRDEGVKLRLYQDTVGKWTIGVGRNLSDDGISQDEADLMLSNDISAATLKVTETFPWTVNLDTVRLAVLVNMAFNMGIGGLATFKETLAMIQAGSYDEAAQEMMDSQWATQVGPRAARLALQLRTGQWQ